MLAKIALCMKTLTSTLQHKKKKNPLRVLFALECNLVRSKLSCSSSLLYQLSILLKLAL